MGFPQPLDSRLPHDVRGRNLDLCGVHHIAASVSSALVAAATQRAAVAQLVATAELERDDVIRLCAVRSHAVLVVQSHAADRAVDDAAGLFCSQYASAPTPVLAAGRPSHDPLAVCARSVVSPSRPTRRHVGGCLGTSIARAMGWVQVGSRVVFVTYPVPGHPPGGLTDPPPVARTHGWSRSRTRAGAHPWALALRTWVLVRRACVAYVRETTSPYRSVSRDFLGPVTRVRVPYGPLPSRSFVVTIETNYKKRFQFVSLCAVVVRPREPRVVMI